MAWTLRRPEPDEYSTPFWDGCAAGELRIQRCVTCGLHRFPPRPVCPSCHGFDHDWVAMSGRGSIWSWVVPHPPLLPGYSELAPYPVVVVELDEDPTLRMVGNLVAEPGAQINSVAPADVVIGAAVEVCFEPIADESLQRPLALPRWVLS